MSPQSSTSLAGRQEWSSLAILVAACLTVGMDLTILILAIPEISTDLRPSSAQLLWVSDIYGYFIAAGLILAGALGDRIGHKYVLLTGIALFGAASLAAATAGTAPVLIAARAVQGIGGATLVPTTMALVFTMFTDARQRATALGAVMAAFGFGAALGPLAAGLLLENFSWGSVFFLNIPICITVLVLGPRLLPKPRHRSEAAVDVASAGLLIVTILSGVHVIKDASYHGMSSPLAFQMAGALIAGGLFIARQRSTKQPLVDLGLFRSTTFSTVLACNLLCFFVFTGMTFFTSQFLQLVLGLSPLKAALWGLPGVAMMLIGSGLTPRLLGRFSVGQIITGGVATTGVGMALLTLVNAERGLAVLVPAWMLVAFGVVPSAVLGLNLIIGAVPRDRAGMAAGLGQSVNELGAALGIGLLGALGTAVFRRHLSGLHSGDNLGVVLENVDQSTRVASQGHSSTGCTLWRWSRPPRC
jgi:DHA2 family multidrug resistance protein-like MFS transporter